MFVATHNGPQFFCGQAPPVEGPMGQRGTYAKQERVLGGHYLYVIQGFSAIYQGVGYEYPASLCFHSQNSFPRNLLHAKGEALCLSQPKQRRAMLADILEALQALASDGTGLSSLKLLPILTTSFLVLLHSWGEFIPPSDEILPTLLTILEGLSDREISWLDRTHARLIAATTLVLTSAPLPGLDLPCLPALLRLACSVAQRHVSRLQHELRGLGPSSSAKASKDDSDEAMETEHHANPTPDDPTGVCVASLRLVQAICNVQSDGEEARSRGLGVVRDSGLLHSLLGALECALAHRVQLNFSLSALDLFLTVAASSQVTKHFSFPVSTAGM
uniref:nucleoporin NUP188-like isoform X4 n=1 Tax=Myxine glutinosa TaxID=7769 RepID=UPI00359007FB